MLRVFPNPNSWKKFLAEYQGIINYPPVIWSSYEKWSIDVLLLGTIEKE
jgi:hypothetical protein